MKITGTRSYILVEFKDKKVKIEGELTLTPTFYASIGSIENWESPHQDIMLTSEEKRELIADILKYNNPDFKIIFED
ncbi:Imm74 family immunity protein [Mucilaginibacter sp.]|uniref:Imm74 family immunity protein n=1 Tax=Mucilaginibacter sp. TaxID=1882438 RepID=UPI0025F19291|nr:Imm74 family immunity protein [Mucilaginibacter sp.]